MKDKVSIIMEWLFLVGALLLMLKGEIHFALLFLIICDLKELKRKLNNTGIKIQISREEEYDYIAKE